MARLNCNTEALITDDLFRGVLQVDMMTQEAKLGMVVQVRAWAKPRIERNIVIVSVLMQLMPFDVHCMLVQGGR